MRVQYEGLVGSFWADLDAELRTVQQVSVPAPEPVADKGCSTGGLCIRSALGRTAVGILEIASRGVDSDPSPCRYRVLLTADDI